MAYEPFNQTYSHTIKLNRKSQIPNLFVFEGLGKVQRNVDLIKQAGVIIYTQYEKYFCYLANPSEMQSAIKSYL